MATKDPKSVLEMRMPYPATPARVGLAARMFDRALAAAAPDLPEGSVTMVVRNFRMRIALRAQRPAGRRALEALAGVMSEPLRAVQRRPLAKRIADVVAKEAKALAPLRPKMFAAGRSTPIAQIDEAFVGVMEGAARYVAPEEDARTGSSEVYARILRIGRQVEGGSLSVRVRVDETARDIPLCPHASADVVRHLFDAARDERIVRLEVDMVWLRGPSGQWEFDRRGTCVTGVEEFEPLSGADFADAALSVIEPRSDEEITRIISEQDEP